MFKKLIVNNGNQPYGTLIERFIDEKSIKDLKSNIQNYLSDKSEIFNDEVTITAYDGEELQMNMVVSEMKKFSDHTLYIGMFTSLAKTTVSIGTYDYADEVNNLLKRENVRISDALGEKITNIFKQKTLNIKNQNNTFFTKRENEVLCLSMEGLPIKIIADKLSISDRTVEKYRTKMMEKSGSSNMIEVIIFALKNRLIEI